ncbi:hypothetical protein AHAS_Ahas15G0261100 [Arachis hypogaea]
MDRVAAGIVAGKHATEIQQAGGKAMHPLHHGNSLPAKVRIDAASKEVGNGYTKETDMVLGEDVQGLRAGQIENDEDSPIGNDMTLACARLDKGSGENGEGGQ